MPLANAFLTPDQFDREYFYEMTPAFCSACGMFQITEQPDPAVPGFTQFQNSDTIEAYGVELELEDQEAGHCAAGINVADYGCVAEVREGRAFLREDGS